MPRRTEWTPAEDATIITMRAARIGAEAPPPEPAEPEIDLSRPPFPPGHPETWDIIIAGTCLDGTPYPRLTP
jgi:hypothetical protein